MASSIDVESLTMGIPKNVFARSIPT